MLCLDVMKKSSLMKLPVLFAGVALLASGCVYRERTVYRGGGVVETDSGVEVAGDPPPPQEEVVGVAPGPDVIWVGGYWGWVGGRWVWNHGYWGHPPRRGAVWVGPRVVVRGGHRIWMRGEWH